MFDFQKEVILNKVDGVVSVDAGVVTIKRNGEYKLDNIAGLINKTVGKKGENSQMIFKGDALNTAINGAMDGNVGEFALTIKIKMLNKFLGEYANANWALFGKPILVTFVTKRTDDAAAKIAIIEKALKDAMPVDNKFMTIEVAAAAAGDIAKGDLVLTLTDPYACFESAALEVYDLTACDSCYGHYDPAELGDAVKIKENVEPFGTGEWIIENLRFPSYPNRRYAPLYADETPMPGVIYNMYSFAYKVPIEGHGGLGFVGQNLESVTRHVYYVPEALAGEFETMFGGIDKFVTVE